MRKKKMLLRLILMKNAGMELASFVLSFRRSYRFRDQGETSGRIRLCEARKANADQWCFVRSVNTVPPIKIPQGTCCMEEPVTWQWQVRGSHANSPTSSVLGPGL